MSGARVALLDAPWNPFGPAGRRARAGRLLEEGFAHENAGRIEEARAAYERAARIDRTWSAPPYDLGLLYKRQRAWARSAEWNERAVERDPANEAAWWNLGIAATALARWELARRAWREFGVDVPDGDGPIDRPCGRAPIRLEAGEVVWSFRLDPARARIENVPQPGCGHRWGDVVLNDGAPAGTRVVDGHEYPVFDALELLEASPYSTFVLEAQAPAPEAAQQLRDLADERGMAAEDWTSSVRVLCKACSEGSVDDAHDHAPERSSPVHVIGVAALTRSDAESLVADWAARSGVAVGHLELGLPAS